MQVAPVHRPDRPPSPQAQRPGPGWPVLALGFRPFYLLAGAFAAVSTPLWAAQYAGWLGDAVLVRGAQWHAHEMLFGYTLAVIVGFLFTAVRNWTQRPTPSGRALAALATLWIAGRVIALTPWALWSAVADTAFLLGAAAGIARPLIGAGNRRNYFFVGLLLALAAANLAFHAAEQGAVPFSTSGALRIALDVVLLIMAIMAGRVVPMFINNALPGAGARRHPALERAAIGALLLLLAADLAGAHAAAALVAAAAALAHGARLALWAPLATRGNALLWILPASYAWIVAHLALRAAEGAQWTPPGLANHALTIGAIGGLTLGMMTRSARGHTGRPLAAGAAEVTCFVLVQTAAAVRVLLPIAAIETYVTSVAVSALLWSAAFTVFTTAYWPILTQPRRDARPG